MFEKFLSNFTHWQSRCTYRQRFLFFSSIFFIIMPLPTYWMLKVQNFSIERKERELQGIPFQNRLFKALNHLISYQIQKATAPENNTSASDFTHSMDQFLIALSDLNSQDAHFKSDSLGIGFSEPTKNTLNLAPIQQTWLQIKHALSENDPSTASLYEQLIHQISLLMYESGYTYRSFLNTGSLNNELIKLNLIDLPKAQELIFKIDRLSLKEPSKETEAALILFLHLFEENNRQILHRLQKISVYLNASNELPEYDTETISNHIAKYHTASFEFLGALKNRESGPKIKPLEKRQKTDIMFVLNQSLWKSNQRLFTATTTSHLESDRFQRTFGLSVLAFTCFIVLFYCVARVLSISLVALRDHIKEMAKGNFSPCFCSGAHDEFGAIGRDLDKMGDSIQGIVKEIEKLSKHLSQIASQIDVAAQTQVKTVREQEASITAIKETAQSIATHSHELAANMNALTETTRNNLSGNEAKGKFDRITNILSKLTTISYSLISSLDSVKEKVSTNYRLINQMLKISDKASLLHLNCSITNAPVEHASKNFNKITREIQRFSEKITHAIDSIKTTTFVMLSNVANIRIKSTVSLKDINKHTKQLEEVNHNLLIIIKQEQEQLNQFESLNELMKQQDAASENIIKSLDKLDDISNENGQSIQALKTTTSDLNSAANRLQLLISSFFSRKDKV